VYDLEQLELAYAPPCGAAKDPVNMAGFAAANILRGDVEVWYPEEFPEKTRDGMIIDVRPPEAFAQKHIPGAMNIPFGKLRSSLGKIPRDKNIFLHCRVGYTSYLAYRILKQQGYGRQCLLKSLTGGLETFSWVHEKLFQPGPAKAAGPGQAAGSREGLAAASPGKKRKSNG
jgi:rhodanese-related sulfurtransferase